MRPDSITMTPSGKGGPPLPSRIVAPSMAMGSSAAAQEIGDRNPKMRRRLSAGSEPSCHDQFLPRVGRRRDLSGIAFRRPRDPITKTDSPAWPDIMLYQELPINPLSRMAGRAESICFVADPARKPC